MQLGRKHKTQRKRFLKLQEGKLCEKRKEHKIGRGSAQNKTGAQSLRQEKDSEKRQQKRVTLSEDPGTQDNNQACASTPTQAQTVTCGSVGSVGPNDDDSASNLVRPNPVVPHSWRALSENQSLGFSTTRQEISDPRVGWVATVAGSDDTSLLTKAC